MNADQYNSLTREIIGAAIEVHKILGPGLLENAYKLALQQELRLRGFKAEREKLIPFIYKGVSLESTFRADLIVEDKIVLELKATEKENEIFLKQLTTYLKLTGMKLGLLINFNHVVLKDGLRRVVNNL